MLTIFKQETKIPKKLDEIHDAVVRNLRGKINPQTKKKYTESEMWAIAQAQYKKTKKSFEFVCNADDCWEEEVMLKSVGTKSKQRFVSVIVSGLESDRQDEMMSQDAIDDMIKQYKSGTIPMFADHGLNPVTGNPGTYTWKGIMGVWTNAVQEGNHLKATLRLNEAHPDADLFFNYIKNDMPVGFSIGANPVEEPKMVEIEEGIKEAKINKARGEGQGVGGEKQGDGGADSCVCPKCGYKAKHEKGKPCGNCPKCGAKMVGK